MPFLTVDVNRPTKLVSEGEGPVNITLSNPSAVSVFWSTNRNLTVNDGTTLIAGGQLGPILWFGELWAIGAANATQIRFEKTKQVPSAGDLREPKLDYMYRDWRRY